MNDELLNIELDMPRPDTPHGQHYCAVLDKAGVDYFQVVDYPDRGRVVSQVRYTEDNWYAWLALSYADLDGKDDAALVADVWSWIEQRQFEHQHPPTTLSKAKGD